MVLAYHLVISTYGFWLPNDPRGSGSETVWSKELQKFGPSTKTDSRRSVAHRPHDRTRRFEAKKSLKHPAVEFTGRQALAVAHGFARCVETNQVTLYACAILTSHVHLVASAHERGYEWICKELKRAATFALINEKLHPFADRHDEGGGKPSCWGRGQWAVFLNNQKAIDRAIRYVEKNPTKENKRAQRWTFVRRFVGNEEF